MRWEDYKTLSTEAKEEYNHRFRRWQTEQHSLFREYLLICCSVVMVFSSIALWLSASQDGFPYHSYFIICDFANLIIIWSIIALIIDYIIKAIRNIYCSVKYVKFRKANNLKVFRWHK